MAIEITSEDAVNAANAVRLQTNKLRRLQLTFDSIPDDREAVDWLHARGYSPQGLIVRLASLDRSYTNLHTMAGLGSVILKGH